MSLFTDIRDVFTGKTFVNAITGGDDATEAAKDAAWTQSQMAGKGIEEQRRQFNKIVQMMNPYVQSGATALGMQQGMLGMGENGQQQQQQAFNQIRQSPEYQSMYQSGENAMLQNASATGGLRGGNLQGALAQYRPQLLNQLFQQKYANLGGLASQGQAAAGLQAGYGQTNAANIANLYGQQGAAIAGGQLAEGQQGRQLFQDVMGIAGLGVGLYSGGMFGGGASRNMAGGTV